MQERSHAFAMKSQMWLLDPRPNLESVVKAVEDGFELSEASNTPVMLEVRIRTCHVHGQFVAKDNQRPAFTLREALENPRRDVEPHRAAAGRLSCTRRRSSRSAGPPRSSSSRPRKLNEHFGPAEGEVGIILQGGMYNSVMRALQFLGLADVYGDSRGAALRPERHLSADRRRGRRLLPRQDAPCIMVEEGQPEYIEQALQHDPAPARHPHAAQRQGRAAAWAANTPPRCWSKGLDAFLEAHAPALLGNRPPVPSAAAGAGRSQGQGARRGGAAAARRLLHRLPGAADLRGHEARRAGTRPAPRRRPTSAATCSRSCRPSTSAPPRWAMGSGPASASAFNVPADKRADLGHGRRRLLAQRPRDAASATPCSTSRTASSWSSTISIRPRPAGRTSCRRAPTTRAARPTTRSSRPCKGIGVDLGAPDRPHLRRGQDARHLAGGADLAPRRARRSSSPRRNAC